MAMEVSIYNCVNILGTFKTNMKINNEVTEYKIWK